MKKIILVMLLMHSALCAQNTLPVPTHANVSYGTHERHVLDFWQAKSEKPAPLLIFIHGGGWAGGEKTDLPVKLLDAMLKNGISVASITIALRRWLFCLRLFMMRPARCGFFTARQLSGSSIRSASVLMASRQGRRHRCCLLIMMISARLPCACVSPWLFRRRPAWSRKSSRNGSVMPFCSIR